MLQYFDTLADVSGNALPGATVTVTNYPSGTAATLYTTNGTANPVATGIATADITGQVNFFAPDGAYTFTYKYNGTIYKVRSPVQLLDPMAFVSVPDTGPSANNYAVSGAAYPAQKYPGLKLEVAAAHSNTGASSLVYQGDAGFAINQPGGSALIAGMIQANGLFRLEWDGTQWELVGAQSQPFYVVTAAETAAGAVIVNSSLPPGYVLRYGNNATPGTTDMTAAITTAVAQAIQPNGAPVFFSTCTGGSGITANDYAVTAAIAITGALKIQGQFDRLSFTGPRINKINNATGTAANASVFTITGGNPVALVIEDLGFAYTGGTAVAGAAFVYATPSGGANSLYFRNVWFFTPPYYALNLSGMDDIQVLGCTFDVTAQRWMELGGAAGITNFSCIGSTFYNQAASGSIDVISVKNFIFTGNRFYWDGTHQLTYAIDLQTNATANLDVVITGNTFEGVTNVIRAASTTSQLIFANNSVKGVVNGPAVSIGGGVACNKFTITGNILSGYAGASAGMIDATGTPLTNCLVKDNTLECNVGGSSGYGVNAPAGSNSGCRIENNIIIGASTASYAVAAYSANYYDIEGSFTPTIAGSTGAGSATYSTQAGKFKLKGRTLEFEAVVALASFSGATGNTQLGGLPIPIGTTNAVAAVGAKNGITQTYASMSLQGTAGASFFRVGNYDATHDWADIAVSGVAGTAGLAIAGFYFVD